MKGYDFSTGKAFEGNVPGPGASSSLFLACTPGDARGLMDVFGWDGSTVQECTNLDENVRYTVYRGYDFTSLIYVEAENGELAQREINVFFSKNYLALVLPEHMGARLSRLTDGLWAAVGAASSRPAPLAYLYYLIFDRFAADLSDALEAFEDDIQALSEAIETSPDKRQSAEIRRTRKAAYLYKKLLRALSYIGGQIEMDENALLGEGPARYFRSIDNRLVKLYDFAAHLFDMSNELLHEFDSRFAAMMNETINKLTVVTLFFGPLTLIAGIYGMNFSNMPELHWKYGYPASLALMAAVSAFIYFMLKRNKWL